jgi:hypothetical protein
MGVSPAGKLAVSLFEELIELRPGEPAVTKLPLEITEAKQVHQLVYRDEILTTVGARGVTSWRNGRVVRKDAVGDTTYMAMPAAADITVVTANDRMVHLLRHGAHLAMPLTGAPEGMYRVAATPGSSRVVATAKDALLVWEIDALFPALVDAQPGVFLANRKAVVAEGMTGSWYIWDVDTNARTPVKSAIDGVPLNYIALVAENRAIAIVHTPKGRAAVGIHADGSSELLVEDLGEHGSVNVVPGNAIIYSLGKGRIFGKVGAETSRELVTLEGDLRSFASTGTLGYAALSTTGELVKGTFGGANFVRTRVADLDKDSFVVGDLTGNVYIGSGKRLLRWRIDVEELARFAVAIDRVSTCELGLYVILSNRDVYFIPATGNPTPQRVPISQLTSISADGRVLAGVSATQHVELVDMPALAAWTLPRLLTALPGVQASPDGARLVQHLGMQVGIWKVVQPGSDFAGWLGELTNATEDEGHVRWPWQP